MHQHIMVPVSVKEEIVVLAQGGAHFGHLARLRTLELDSQVGGAGAAAFDAHLTGLPPSLRRLRLQVHLNISNPSFGTQRLCRP